MNKKKKKMKRRLDVIHLIQVYFQLAMVELKNEENIVILCVCFFFPVADAYCYLCQLKTSTSRSIREILNLKYNKKGKKTQTHSDMIKYGGKYMRETAVAKAKSTSKSIFV